MLATLLSKKQLPYVKSRVILFTKYFLVVKEVFMDLVNNEECCNRRDKACDKCASSAISTIWFRIECLSCGCSKTKEEIDSDLADMSFAIDKIRVYFENKF